MGAEAACTVRLGRRMAEGKARLETDVLQFRGGDIHLSIPFGEISKIASRDGTLTVRFRDATAHFSLGVAASKWASKIRHPPSRLDKLGVRPGRRIAIVHVEDSEFVRELKASGAVISRKREAKRYDAMFFGVSQARDLTRLEGLKAWLAPAGALWVIRPKGRPEISERAVMDAGKAAGLVDVKVVSFSETHTAEKFVIPLAAR